MSQRLALTVRDEQGDKRRGVIECTNAMGGRDALEAIAPCAIPLPRRARVASAWGLSLRSAERPRHRASAVRAQLERDRVRRFRQDVDECEHAPAFVQAQPPFGDRPRGPARGGPAVALVALGRHDHKDPQRVIKRDVRQFRGSRVNHREVLGQEGSAEPRVRGALAGH